MGQVKISPLLASVLTESLQINHHQREASSKSLKFSAIKAKKLAACRLLKKQETPRRALGHRLNDI